jgi:5-methylcytosine-specific restriction endonuclease McrA
MTQPFISTSPELEDYWRAIILFGRNVASYKFALAKSLLELRPESGKLITLDKLAKPFALNVASHLKIEDKQATSASSRFLDQCRKFNAGELSQGQLIEQTVRLGFVNVIDAFHVVGRDETPQRFFLDERQGEGGIRITDEFSKLANTDQMESLPAEVEARWRLVETAWSLGVTRNLLRIDYDHPSESLFALSRENRRITVTSSRDALNGYQKGKCFYCYRTISLKDEGLMPDVDHFFPHVLKHHEFGHMVDGVWNLVLACRNCNRGANGKFERVPSLKLLKRLSNRNEFLISSHHPLKETLIQQTGNSLEKRQSFLQGWHSRAVICLIHQWEPEEVVKATF